MDGDTEDFDVVAMNPAAYYKGPADVLADAELTHAQKLKLLEEWEQDLKRKLESDGEGMAQGTQGNEHMLESRRANDAKLQAEVSKWLRTARGEEPGQDFPSAKKTALGRVWHRIFGGPDKSKIAA